MNGQQLSIFDLAALREPPELWECMATCVHAGGPWDDYFPGNSKMMRCNYPQQQQGIGYSGKNVRQVVRNNRVHFYCILYEEKGAGA